MSEPEGGQRDWRPVPDPTLLTTAQLHRELGTLERFITERAKGTEKVIDERFRHTTARLDRIEKLAEKAAESQSRLDERYDALKERIDRGEGIDAGSAGERQEVRLARTYRVNQWTAAFIAVSIVIAALALILSLVMH